MAATRPKKTCVRYNQPGDAHYITFSCFRKQPFLKHPTLCAWLGESLTAACARCDIALWAYVFMPTHVHLVAKPALADYDISVFLKLTKQTVTNRAKRSSETSGRPMEVWEPYLDIQPNRTVHFRVWQRGGGYDRNVWSPHEALQKIAYLHQNPVRAGLCARPEDYLWSSALDYSRLGVGPIPIEMPDL